MNEKDNDTSPALGEEAEKLKSGSEQKPEKKDDLPKTEIIDIKKKTKEDEVLPENTQANIASTSDENPAAAFDKAQNEEITGSRETSEEEKIDTADEGEETVSDKESKEKIKDSTETPGKEAPVAATDEESTETFEDKTKAEEESVEEGEVPKVSKVKEISETPSKEEKAEKAGISAKKAPETPPGPVEAAKAEKKEPPPKEIVIVEDIEKKPKIFAGNINRILLVIVVIIALALAGTFYAWTSGMNDLGDDNDYLIVVVFKEAEAASIYHKDTGESEIIEVTELEKISDRKLFFESAQKKFGILDRMIIIDVDTLRKLSTDEYILYKDDPEKKITRDEMYNWIIGKDFPRNEIMGNDSPSVVNANMLKSWLDHYEEKLFENWGSYTIKVVLNGYRSEEEKIIIYPGNSALFILKYVAVEKIFFPL